MRNHQEINDQTDLIDILGVLIISLHHPLSLQLQETGHVRKSETRYIISPPISPLRPSGRNNVYLPQIPQFTCTNLNSSELRDQQQHHMIAIRVHV